MKTKLLVIVQLLWLSVCSAQHKEGFNWITGSFHCRASFNTIDTVPSTFSAISYLTSFRWGSSCISDSNGNFLFSTDGFRIWDTMANKMDNGDSLVPQSIMNKDGVSNYSQSSIILPFVDGIYYVITSTISDSFYNLYWTDPTATLLCFDMLLAHKIDMKENGGQGKVVQKTIPILKDKYISRTQMQACRHSNGIDWWLLKQGYDTNIVYKFLIKQDTILGPFVQSFAPYRFGKIENYGQSCFSKDGSKYSVVQGDIPIFLGLGGVHDNGQLFLSDFDRCTGELTNPKYFDIPNLTSYNNSIDSFYGGLGDHGGVGVCFSNNDKFVYISKFFNILQLEINEPDSSLAWHHVAGMDTTYAKFGKYQNIHRGVDNKIYVGNYSGTQKEMSVINAPDNKGAACEFCPKCLRFPEYSIIQPPNLPDFYLGADTTSICWPLAISEYANEPISQLEVYPNPVHTILFIKTKSKAKRELYNSIGQLIFSTNENEIDVSIFDKGIYYLKCGSGVKKVIIE